MVADLSLPMGSRCIKYLMFIFNLLFVITGIILLSIGATIHAVYSNYQHFLDNKFLSVPSLLIAVGSIIFFIAFFGCCGAVRENYCMVITFASLMVLVFILELSAGISGYVLRNEAADMIKNKMLGTMRNYAYDNTTTEITLVWDNLQKDFSCCGTNGPTDWANQTKLEGLPMSCCKEVSGAVGNISCTVDSKTLYKIGCLHSFGSFIKGHAVQLGGAGLGIAFIQGVGIWFSIYLARAIKMNYETV
ncbi:CD63 antigen [Fopius arisanus]|uniref:Tetraspanin n=2 Tax=Fopius arisanus TaxID=64838 RepID=A0A0C9QE23_9HYME|nr:PREDICTED: CD63 antigen [Fopius arisanus]